MDELPLLCHRCAMELKPGEGEFYVVRIEALADPTPPTITEADLQRDILGEIERLLEALHGVSEREAMEQVYRKLTLCLCNACYRDWIENPTR
jgi:hypothetical protein